MSKCYINPPIIEAICEFRFSENTQWDSIVPGLFYERVKDDFPKRNQRVLQEVSFNAKPNNEIEQSLIAHQFIQFLNKDKNRMLQLGGRILNINFLAPYTTWEDFFTTIKNAYEKLKDALAVIDTGTSSIKVDRIGLRYVNHIVIPKTDKDLNIKDYFNISPNLPDNLNHKSLESFLFVYELKYENNANCRIQLQKTTSTPSDTRFKMDLDYRTTQAINSDCDTVFNWVKESHTNVEAIFESSITQKSRDIFGEQS